MSSPYADTRTYLHDYFSLLALRLHRQVALVRRLRGPDQQDAFLGLFLTEAEIDGVLADLHGHAVLHHGQEVQLEGEIQATAARINARLTVTPHTLRPSQLALLFDLSPAAVEVLLLLLALEVDRRFARVYAYLQDDIAHRWLTPGLAMRLLPGALPDEPAARGLFAADSALIYHRLLSVDASAASARLPLIDRPLKLDDRIAEYLLEHDPLPAPLAGYLRADEAGPSSLTLDRLTIDEGLRSQLTNLADLWHTHAAPPIFLWGRAGSGKADVALAMAGSLGRPLLTLDGEQLALAAPDQVDEFLFLAQREADLRTAILHVRRVDLLDAAGQTTLRHRLRPGMILSARSPLHFHDVLEPPVEVHLPAPGYGLREACWRNVLAGHVHLNGPLPGALAGRFRLTLGQIARAAYTAQQEAWLRDGPAAAPQPADLYEGCRRQSNPGLARLAAKVATPYAWDSLVLPATQLDLLHAIESQVRHMQIVHQRWGFDESLALGKGLNALFAGPSGTGKTMAAGILARSLGLDIYKIDLSSVVSKYIGETEKNLSQIFDEAATANAILFFDEADALFGKRSEVKDAHDRYANIEISYLLQKMEEYDGVAILATNLSQNMDEAFTRRLQYVVEFPLPAVEDRERIWRGMFPPQAPVAEDVDFGFLAAQFELTGGNIKNCVLAAAFLAAEEGAAIGMAHLLQGIVRELGKLGRPITRASFAEHFTAVRRKRP